MSGVKWQPDASIHSLQRRALLNRQIRQFFEQRHVLEVETPLLAQHPVSDPYIECLKLATPERDYFLQSSPEYAMKRLLAAGSGDIYSLAKVFRAAESGRRHNIEFTMLEWYRLGLNDQQLMAEVAELVQSLYAAISSVEGSSSPTNRPIEPLPLRYISYRDVFLEHVQIDPHAASLAQLQACIDESLDMGEYRCEDVSSALDIIISQLIEPQLDNGLLFIYDYPASQAALARTSKNEQGQVVAKRFEMFLNGMELANGYWELQDARELRARFESDNKQRALSGLPCVSLDERLLAAMEAGLPECAGVALGVDRLLLQLSKAEHIKETLSFAWENA